jgi:dihydrofolate synthase / folylpolyglutamate synthase
LEGLAWSCTTPVRSYPSLRAGLTGRHQLENAMLAVRAAELLGEPVAEDRAIRKGLSAVARLSGLRGRAEVIAADPLVVADVAHNPEGLAAILDMMRAEAERRGGRLFVLFGALREKDVHGMADELARAGARVFGVRIDSERALDAPELAAILSSCKVMHAGTGSVSDGLAWFRREATPPDALLVSGSHQVVSQLPEMAPAERASA